MKLLDLFKLFKNYKRLTILSIVCNLMYAVFTVISLPYLKVFLDVLFQPDNTFTTPGPLSFNGDYFENYVGYYLESYKAVWGINTLLLYVCLGLVFIFFFKNFFKYFALFFMVPVRNGIVGDLRELLHQKILRLPLSFFSDKQKGNLLSKMSSDVKEVENSVMHIVQVIFREPLIIIVTLIFILTINPKLTLFVFLLFGLSALVITGIGKSLRRKSHEVQSRLGDLISAVEETLSGIKIIKGFQAFEHSSKKFNGINTDYQNLQTRVAWRNDLASPTSEFLGVTIVAVLLFLGASEVFSGNMQASTFMTFLFAFYNISEPTKILAKAYNYVQTGLGALGNLNEVFDAEEKIQSPSAPAPFVFERSIKLDKLSFSYNDRQTVLDGIDLDMEKGKIYAFVGNSGAGKSTLVDLIPRFHDVTSGSILIDGVDIRSFKLADLRQNFGIVTQQAVLFNDTIYNNIVFGFEDATKDAVIEAAKLANAHEFILQSDQGYETNIGDGGSKLSGGQRQRLTIARAILRDPAILILDEATSALDSKSEKLVQDALSKVMKGRTALVIAHRLSTIQHADMIVVMADGKIIEKGSHQELMSKNKTYQSLVELQSL